MGTPEGHNIGLGISFTLDEAAIARQCMYDGFGNAVTDEVRLSEVPINRSDSGPAAEVLDDVQISVDALVEKAREVAADLPSDLISGLQEATRVCESVDLPQPSIRPGLDRLLGEVWEETDHLDPSRNQLFVDPLPEGYWPDGTRQPDTRPDETSTDEHHKGEQ